MNFLEQLIATLRGTDDSALGPQSKWNAQTGHFEQVGPAGANYVPATGLPGGMPQRPPTQAPLPGLPASPFQTMAQQRQFAPANAQLPPRPNLPQAAPFRAPSAPQGLPPERPLQAALRRPPTPAFAGNPQTSMFPFDYGNVPLPQSGPVNLPSAALDMSGQLGPGRGLPQFGPVTGQAAPQQGRMAALLKALLPGV